MTHHRDFVSIGMWVAVVLAATQLQAESNVSKRMIQGELAPSERDEQESLFNYYFRDQNLVYETEFAKLKTSAKVDSWRIPYSAAIYPERSGGLAAARSSTGTVLGKYDLAFHDGRSLAESYDRRRKQRTEVRRGAVRASRRLIRTTMPTPGKATAADSRRRRSGTRNPYGRWTPGRWAGGPAWSFSPRKSRRC